MPFFNQGHRALWSLVWPDATIVAWLCLVLLAASIYSTARAGLRRSGAELAVSLLAFLGLPPFYMHVRVMHQAQLAHDLVEESRLGEAHQLLSQMLELRPQATWRGVDLAQANWRLQAVIEPIAARAAQPLSSTAADEQRLARARDLAMLGRTDEALAMLAASAALAKNPEALALCGAIHESRGAWQAARDCYQEATLILSNRPADASAANQSKQAKALAGMGHCERKLGHLHEAEAAYTMLLATSPTADKHFLVAQFYEDTQQAALAKTHARIAAKLAPAEYQDRAAQLTAKLTTSHFGCLSAFWDN